MGGAVTSSEVPWITLGLLFAAGVALPSLQALPWRNVGPAVAGGRTAGVAGTDADP